MFRWIKLSCFCSFPNNTQINFLLETWLRSPRPFFFLMYTSWVFFLLALIKFQLCRCLNSPSHSSSNPKLATSLFSIIHYYLNHFQVILGPEKLSRVCINNMPFPISCSAADWERWVSPPPTPFVHSTKICQIFDGFVTFFFWHFFKNM